MRKFLAAFAVLMMASCALSYGWSNKGHQIVCAIAQRHLSPKALEEISTVMPYELRKDCSWMDSNRKKEGVPHTFIRHTYAATPSGVYDPNPRIQPGDVLRGIAIADYNFRHPEIMDDSLKLLSIRMLIHFVGDFHCPTHVAFSDISMGGDWFLGDRKVGNFHHVYDAMPGELFKGMSANEVAAMLDDGITQEQVSAWVEGDFFDYLNRATALNRGIYQINPPSPEKGNKQLNPQTYELSRPLIIEQLLSAGYQLAHMLNSYFE